MSASLSTALLLLLLPSPSLASTTTTALPSTTKAPLNGQCTNPPGCSDGNAACISGICICNAGYFQSGGQCVQAATAVPTLGTPTRTLTSLTVTWSAHSAMSGVSGVQYQVSWSGPGSPQTVTGLSYNIQSLTSGMTYSVVVKTVIPYAGRTEMSNDASGTYKTLSSDGQTCSGNGDCGSGFECSTETKCRCPQTKFWSGSACVYSATAVPTLGTPTRTLTSLTVTWSAHSTVTGVSGVQYQVSWNGTGSPQTVSGLSYTIQSLTSGTTYSVVVKTVITYAGRTEMSNSASDTYETLVAYRGTCSSSQSRCSDSNASCFGSPLQCVCNDGFFWNNSLCTSREGLKPSAITIDAVSTDSADVSWTLSQYSSFVTSYSLTTTPSSSTTTVQGGGSNSTRLSGLVPGQTYTVSVSAFISADLRNQTTSAQVSSPRTLKPEKPLGLQVNESTLNETFVVLVFLGVARGYADAYLVTLGDKGTKTVTDSDNNPAVTAKLTVMFGQLSPGVTYVVTIVARSKGVAGEAYIATVRTASNGPSEVTQFNVTSANTTSIGVRWSQPVNRNGDLFAYELRVSVNNTCLQSIVFTCSVCMRDQRKNLIDVSACGKNLTEINNDISEITHTIAYVIMGLNPGVHYTLAVVGYSDGGAGEEKRLVWPTETFLSTEGQVCSVDGNCGTNTNLVCLNNVCRCKTAYFWNGISCVLASSVTPGSLQVTSRGVGSVSLSWTAPSVGSVARIIGYEVRHNNGTVIAPPSGTSQQVTGLSPSVQYSFQVVAKISYSGRTETSSAAIVSGKPLSTENQTCSGDGDCDSNTNLVCFSGTCRCRNSYFWNSDSPACILAIVVKPDDAEVQSPTGSVTLRWSPPLLGSAAWVTGFQVLWSNGSVVGTTAAPPFTVLNLPLDVQFTFHVVAMISYSGRTETSGPATVKSTALSTEDEVCHSKRDCGSASNPGCNTCRCRGTYSWTGVGGVCNTASTDTSSAPCNAAQVSTAVIILAVLCAILGVALILSILYHLRYRRRHGKARDPTYAQTASVPVPEESHPYTELSAFSSLASGRTTSK